MHSLKKFPMNAFVKEKDHFRKANDDLFIYLCSGFESSNPKLNFLHTK